MKCFNFVFIIFFIVGCSSWKEALVTRGNRNDAIHNAIIDFIHTCRLYKDDSIFCIDIYEDRDDIFVLGIMGCDDEKLFPRPVDKIGAYSTYFPSKYLINNNKLFYWCDSTKAITKEIVSVLTKYNYIDSLNVDSIVGISFFINDSKKGADYYFCKNNLRNYKKVVTNRAMGWYPRPKLDCNKLIRKGK